MNKIVTVFAIALSVSATVVLGDGNTNHITKDEFISMQSYFVKSGCNVDGVLKSGKELGVSSTYHDIGDDRQKQIATLSQDSLCLLSRSYYPDVRYAIKKNGREIEKSSEKYPADPAAVVTEIMFRIPIKMAKECDDDTVTAFAVFFRKRNGKLQREIVLNDDLLPCNEGMLDVPKNYKYKKGNN